MTATAIGAEDPDSLSRYPNIRAQMYKAKDIFRSDIDLSKRWQVAIGKIYAVILVCSLQS